MKTLLETTIRVTGATATTVHTRALVTDVNGNPTPVTVTAQDQLIITYKLAAIGSDVDGTGTVTLAGQNYNWVTRRGAGLAADKNLSSIFSGNLRPNVCTDNAGIFGNAGQDVGGGSSNIGSSITNRIAGRVQHTITANISEGNSGIKLIGGANSLYKIQFTPTIPKDATKVFSLVTEYTLSRA